MDILDNPAVVAQRDPDNALGVVENEWQQASHEFNINVQPTGEIRNIVLAGMGGSALPGVFLQSWPGLTVPLEVVRNYNLPTYVNEYSLVVALSHSGNTEETLSALDEAETVGAQIVVVAAGGKLAERAELAGYPLFRIPGGIQPRMTTFFFLRAFAELFESLGLAATGTSKELAEAGEWLKGEIGSWLPSVPSGDNLAKQLAGKLVGKSVVVYSGPKLFPAANKWKICVNENAKTVAWTNQLPEFNHNEFIGWSSHPIEKPYAIVDLRSNLEHPRVQKRFEVTERLLSGMRPAPNVVEVKGETLIKQLLWAVSLGGFTTLYLAVLNGVNPTPVELVEKFKKELG